MDNHILENQKITPRISVVIPLYNKAAHIGDTLKSVMAQTIPAFEVIVVDDGSTDGGVNVVKSFSKVRLVSQPNGGVSRARNAGIAHSRGDFVAFLDADDEWIPHFLEEITHLICTFPSATLFTTGYQICVGENQFKKPKIVYNHKTTQPHILSDYFSVGSKGAPPFMMSSTVANKMALTHIGLFPEDEPMGEDQDFFCRAALKGSIAHTPRVLLIYHTDTTNRACDIHIPLSECPFSLRLRQWANNTTNAQLQSDMLDYCAAHVIHIASENVRHNNLKVARELLKDPITKRLKVKRLAWLTRCEAKAL